MSRPICITIRLPVDIGEVENGCCAACPLLAISCVGGSTNEALNQLAGILTRHLVTCFDLGRFDQLFHCNGYSALEEDTGPGDGRYLDIVLKLGIPDHELSMQEQTHPVPTSLLSTWMT